MEDTVLSAKDLYPVAMAVGTSLDLRKTVCTALQAIVRTFECSFGMVMLAQWGNDRLSELTHICIYPQAAATMPESHMAAERARQVLHGQTRRSLALLTIQREDLLNAPYCYLLPLPEHGVLVLNRRCAPLSPAEIAALDPICRKLEQSIDHALRFQQVQTKLDTLETRYQAIATRVDEFLTAVSHELHAPLTLMMGFIETLLDGRPGPLTATQKRFLENSYKSSDRMLALVDNLMTVTHFRQGDIQLDTRPLFPSQLLNSLTDKITALAMKKAIILSIKNEWDAKFVCWGDQRWLEKVVIQLVENAVKFTPAAETVHVHSIFVDRMWHFKVSDTGIGIPEHEVERVFEWFYRGRHAKLEQMDGVGVGLCLSKAVIDAHGGDIGIRNNPRRGVTAWFTLPAHPATQT